MTHKQATILAVDDEEINRFILEDLLEEQYDIDVVASGQACLEHVKQSLPDLILLDINMPEMDGYEVCRQLQSSPRTRSIPVLFLTARVMVEDEKRGLELGAVDYITKPFSEALLLARIQTHLKVSQSQKLLKQRNEQLKQEREYIERIILNMRQDADFDGQAVRCLMSPVEDTNGDLLLSAKSGEHRYFLIGDFTGHGLAAAMGGPLVSALFYLLAEQRQALPSIIQTLNSELYKKMPPDIFMAAVFIDWVPQRKRLRIWNFAMPPVLLFRDNLAHDIQVASAGLALGILDSVKALQPVFDQKLLVGDRVVAYSDGVIELHNTQRETLGIDGLKDRLTRLFTQQQDFEELQQHLLDYTAGEPVHDDITLLEVEIE